MFTEHMTKAMTRALIATAALAATVAVASPAAAETDRFQFLTPSGNIGCQMDTAPDGAAYAWCKVIGHTWAAAPESNCQKAYLPGAIGEPTDELQLRQGSAACTGFVMSQLFFSGEYAPPTLAYGQSHSVGSITCDSQPAGVTCTDADTGHFFRISRESYQIG